MEKPTPAPGQAPASPAPTATNSPAAGGSKGLATASLVLAIIGAVAGILVFISVPLAIAAVIMGIVVLAKHKLGRGLAIAGIVIGGLTLAVAPITAMITIVAYQGISERAREAQQKAEEAQLEKEQLFQDYDY